MAYIAFPPEGEPYHCSDFTGRDPQPGLIACSLKEQNWYLRRESPFDDMGEKFYWEKLTTDEVPPEMRTYVLLHT